MDLKKIQEELESHAAKIGYETSLKDWKLEMDNIMLKHAQQGTIFNYYVKCDEENNVYLEHDIKVIDIYVEPKKGEGVFVNQITILKSGEISKGGNYNSI